MSFVCLDDPALGAEQALRPLRDCARSRNAASTPDSYNVPHLYALVTQPPRGEVAVVDLTTNVDAVLDGDLDAFIKAFLLHDSSAQAES